MTFPPNPEGQNKDRAAWAERALLAYMISTGADWADALPDLLCDLTHLADRDAELEFAQALAQAYWHYEAETIDPIEGGAR